MSTTWVDVKMRRFGMQSRQSSMKTDKRHNVLFLSQVARSSMGAALRRTKERKAWLHGVIKGNGDFLKEFTGQLHSGGFNVKNHMAWGKKFPTGIGSCRPISPVR